MDSMPIAWLGLADQLMQRTNATALNGPPFWQYPLMRQVAFSALHPVRIDQS
jgi:hypothetical protein